MNLNPIDFPVGIDGGVASGRKDLRFESLHAETDTPAGRVVFDSKDDEDYCRLPTAKQATLANSVPLSANNVLAGYVVINGLAYAYTRTYNSSSAETLGLLKDDLVALAGGGKVTGAVSGNNIILTATPGNSVYFDTGAVTGGTAVTVTLTNTDPGTFEGLSFREERMPKAGQAVYEKDIPVSVVRRGRLFIRSKDQLTKGQTAYVQLVSGATDAERPGLLAASAGNGKVPNVAVTALKIRKGCAAGGYAEVAISEAT